MSASKPKRAKSPSQKTTEILWSVGFLVFATVLMFVRPKDTNPLKDRMRQANLEFAAAQRAVDYCHAAASNCTVPHRDSVNRALARAEIRANGFTGTGHR